MAYTNQLTKRHRLHHELIDVEDRPCACGSRDRREIHRIIPGYQGGEYTEYNVAVLCFTCHRKAHPNSKFRVGDRASVNGRTPQYIDLPRHRPRTIIAVKYDADKQCNFYLLGCNGKGANSGQGNPLEGYNDYWFRSYQLLPIRRWHHHRNYNQSPCDKQQAQQKTKLDVDYSPDQNFNPDVSLDTDKISFAYVK